MASPLEEAAEKKRKALEADRQRQINELAVAVATETLKGVKNLTDEQQQILGNEIASLARSVGSAFAISNENIRKSFAKDFKEIVSLTKLNIEGKLITDKDLASLHNQIAQSITSLDSTIAGIKFDPKISLEQSDEEKKLREEITKLIEKLPKDSKRTVKIEYEKSPPTNYINVRLTDGVNFYKALGGSGGGSGGGVLPFLDSNQNPVGVQLTDEGKVPVDIGEGTIQAEITNASVEIANDTGSPVPVSGTVTAQQPTHDNFNTNANVQVGDADVSGANPIPISGTVTATGAELNIQEVLSFSAYNLASAVLNQTTAISTDYLASQLELHFSTRAKRTITLTTEDGTVWRTITDDTSLDRVISLGDQAFEGGEQLTLNITQTASPCTVTGKLVIKQGSQSLGGDTPVLLKGQEFGSAEFDFFKLQQHARDTAQEHGGLPVLDSQAFTVDAGTDVFTSAGHGLANGDTIVFGSDDTLPEPLNPIPTGKTIRKLTEYYVVSATTDTFKVSTSEGGTAVDIEDTGTGTHTWYKPTVHTGDFIEVDQIGGLTPIFVELGDLDTAVTEITLQWSDDGLAVSSGLLNATNVTLQTIDDPTTGLTYTIGLARVNDMIAKYYRARIVGGIGTPVFNLFSVLVNKNPLTGTIGTLEDQISTLTSLLFTRSVIAGIRPDGVLSNAHFNEDSAIVTADFLLEVAKGNTPLHSMAEVQGYNPDIDTGTTPEDVSGAGGVYAGFPTAGTAETARIVSTSASDTSAGTGARTILLTGLDENWEEQTETLTLNGTTPVDGTLLWQRIRRIHVATAGSGGANVGTISVTHTTTTANAFASIAVGRNQSGGAVFTVPANKTGFLTDFSLLLNVSGGSASAACLATIRVRDFGGVFRTRKIYNITASTSIDRHYSSPIRISAKSDIKVTIESVTDNNTQVAAEIGFTLSENV